MTKLAIFSTEQDAINYSNKLHQYLMANRPNYNAIKWCDPEQSADGLRWVVKEPVEQNENRWSVPINTATELAQAEGRTEELPGVGGLCIISQYYLFKGDVYRCRQTHNRTIYEPLNTPALFSVFQDNTDQLQWIAGEQVEVGWMRIYEGIKYEVIQSHQTQADWTPPVTPTLWKDVTPVPNIPVWVQPTGAHDAYNIGDKVHFPTINDPVYESLINANVWSPTVYPQGWLKL